MAYHTMIFVSGASPGLIQGRRIDGVALGEPGEQLGEQGELWVSCGKVGAAPSIQEVGTVAAPQM